MCEEVLVPLNLLCDFESCFTVQASEREYLEQVQLVDSGYPKGLSNITQYASSSDGLSSIDF
jgi:hypothetical protein